MKGGRKGGGKRREEEDGESQIMKRGKEWKDEERRMGEGARKKKI